MDAFDRLQPNTEGVLHLYYRYDEVTLEVVHNYPTETVAEDADTYFLNTVIDRESQAGPVVFHDGVLYQVESYTITAKDGGVAVAEENGKFTLTEDTVVTYNYKVAEDGVRVEHYLANDDGSYNNDPDYATRETIQFGDTLNAADYDLKGTGVAVGYTYDPDEQLADGFETISFTGEMTEPDGSVLKLYYKRNTAEYTVEHYYQNLDGTYPTEPVTYDGQGGSFQFGDTVTDEDFHMEKPGFTYTTTEASVSSISWTEGNAPAGTVLKLYYERQETTYNVEHYFEQLGGGFALETKADEQNLRFQYGKTFLADSYVITREGYDYDADNANGVSKIEWVDDMTAPSGTTLKLYYTLKRANFDVRYYFEQADGSFAENTEEALTGNPFLFGEEHESSAYRKTFTGFTYDAENEGNITSISWTEGDAPAGTELKLYYKRNATEFTVEHYYQNVDGTFPADPVIYDDQGGSFKYGDEHSSEEFIREQNGLFYDAENENGISEIRFDGDTPSTGATLKLYYVRDAKDFTVKFFFETAGEPGQFTEDEALRLREQEFVFGTTHNAADYQGSITLPAGYEYNAAATEAKGFQSITWTGDMTEPSGNELQLYFTLKRATFEVHHYFEDENGEFVENPDFALTNQEFIFDTSHSASSYVQTVTGFSFDGTIADAQFQNISWTEGDAPTNTVLKLYYKRNIADFTVEHYFEQTNGTFARDDEIDTGSFKFGDTKTADAFIRTVTGYTYDANVEGSIGSISWIEGDQPTGTVLKLYYVRNSAAFTVEHYLEQADGTFEQFGDIDTGSFQFGDTKEAAAFIRTVTGYTYDASVEGSIGSISWTEGNAPAATVLKLYYVRNSAAFTVEHYFEQADGAFVKDDVTDTDSFKFGETKTADAFVRDEAGYTYDAENENGISSISWTEGDAPTATLLKLYYVRNAADYTVEHYFEQADGTYTLDETVDTGSFRFGDTITADAFVRTVTGYSYDAENENGISSISWTEGDAPAANVLKLYYGINEHTLTIHYLYDEDDSQAAPDYTATLKYGDSYEVASPEIDGFLVDIEVVEGTMPDEDVVVIVYYLEIEDIPSSETPLGPPPEESSEPEEPIESIPDIEPPLGPNTGSSDHNIAVLVLTSLFALGALMVVVVRRKKEEK